MESRVERYKKIKNNKKQRCLRIVIFVVCLLLFFTSLYKVDKTLREIMCISDKRICGFENTNELYSFYLLGDNYIISKEQIEHYLDKIVIQFQRVLHLINDYKDELFNN